MCFEKLVKSILKWWLIYNIFNFFNFPILANFFYWKLLWHTPPISLSLALRILEINRRITEAGGVLEKCVRPATLFKKEALAQVFTCEFCEIFKNIYFYRTRLVAASGLILKVNFSYCEILIRMGILFWKWWKPYGEKMEVT